MKGEIQDISREFMGDKEYYPILTIRINARIKDTNFTLGECDVTQTKEES